MLQRPQVPGYLKHESGQARVLLNGKVFYLGKYGSKASRQRYDTLIAEYLASGRSKSFGVVAAQLSVGRLIIDYVAHCKRYYSGGAEYVSTKVVMRAVSTLYASLPATSFGTSQFKAIRQKLIDDPICLRSKKCTLKSDKPLSRPYINDQMKRVARMFKWAAAEGILPAEIYNSIRLVPSLQRGRTTAAEPNRVEPVSIEVVAATIPHCSQVVADMIRFHLLTGCRPQDVCNLTPSMFDKSGDVWVATLPEHKTAWRGHVRVLYLGPEAQRVIAPYLDREKNANCFSPTEADKQRRSVLTAKRKTSIEYGNSAGTNVKRKPKRSPGTKYDSRSYYRAVAYACEKAKIDRWSPNQLRHTAATMIRSEFGLEHAQAILGHAKADITEVYAVAGRHRAIEAARVDASRLIPLQTISENLG